MAHETQHENDERQNDTRQAAFDNGGGGDTDKTSTVCSTNSSTLQLNAAGHALAKRRRHWRRRPEGIGDTGDAARAPPPHCTGELGSPLTTSRCHPRNNENVVSHQVERHAFETIGRNPPSRLPSHPSARMYEQRTDFLDQPSRTRISGRFPTTHATTSGFQPCTHCGRC